MVTFNNFTGYPIGDAIAKAESLFLPESKMMQEIKNKDDFRFNTGYGVQVWNHITFTSVVISIFSYRPKLPWSKAIGYFDGKSIFINERIIEKLSQQDIIGLLCHEACHAFGYNHGLGRLANYATDEKKLYSLPYFVSENISKWL